MYSTITFHSSLALFPALAYTVSGRYMMYLTGQHPLVPEKSLVSDITHVALAFMRPSVFNQEPASAFPLFTTVHELRAKFSPGTAILVAIGGWGDSEGFEVAAVSDDSRKLFARNIKKMIEITGADGVDIDWEYPGGNGEDYKQIPNLEKAWQIDAYPLLLSKIRAALGPDKIMSAAVPGIPRDMLAFTKATIPAISASLDFFNIMTYDLMNRRDNVTKHHTGISESMIAIRAYEEIGVKPEKMNLGFAFYIKWFKTDPRGGCDKNPIGCTTALMEDPNDGADLGGTGGFSWHDPVPEDVSTSYKKAISYGRYDEVHGGHYYWDADENLWWSWDTPDVISKKFPAIMQERGVGGAFAWGLGEDANGFIHLEALTAGMRRRKGKYQGKKQQTEYQMSSSLQLKDEL